MRKPTSSLCLWLLRFAVLASATLLCLCCTVQAQRTTRIPADVPTIQAAIDASTTGDTLLVAPGTYFENLNLHGKAILLRSAEGPSVTILDGRNLAPVVTFATHETRATTLSGFTLRHGAPANSSVHGGGILLVDASPTLTGNVLTANRCAALDATNSAPLLHHNTIRQTQPAPVCIAQPIAPILIAGGAPTLRGNLIEQNDLSGSDALTAGIALAGAQATLEGNILRANTVSNDAPSALSLEGDAQPTLIQQNLIAANRSHCGPAVSIASTSQLVNNTLADNLSDPACPRTSQAAELSLATASVFLANNIVSTTAAHPALICTPTTAPQSPHRNLLDSAAPDTCPTSLGSLHADPLFADPLFADPLFMDRLHADYRLSPHSPALDAGSSLPSLPPQDLDGTPRTHAGSVDLGAYEHAIPHALAASTTLLNATPNPAEAFQSISLTAQVTTASAIPTGSVTFSANAQTLATVPLDATGRAAFTTTTLPAGSPILTAAYPGSDTLEPSSSTLTQRFAPATALLSFALTPSSADETQTVTLSALVKAPLSTQTPTGQVRFLQLDPSSTPTVLATVALDAKGQATTTLPSMPTGTWLIDAAYLATPNFTPVVLPASDALTLTIAARGYTLTSATPAVTIQSGHHAPVALTLKSIGTFASTLTLSCANLPADATCTFSPAAPGLTAGATVPVTLTLETDAIPGFLSLSRPATGLPVLACALLFIAFKRRRRIGLALFLCGLAGCSSKYPAQVPPGTYSIQVVSQASGSSSTQTLPLTLVVTN
jgi:hypothetical protein